MPPGRGSDGDLLWGVEDDLRVLGKAFAQAVLRKVNAAVFFSRGTRENLLDGPDFWFPLLVVLSIGWLAKGLYLWCGLVWLFGSGILCFVGRVLGADISISQVLSVTGYCSLSLVFLISLAIGFGRVDWLQSVAKIFGAFWSAVSIASTLATQDMREKNRLLLLLYPCILLEWYMASLI